MSKEIIVKRAAKEVKDGMYINLGIGIPTLIADEIEKMELEVFYNQKMGFWVLEHILQ